MLQAEKDGYFFKSTSFYLSADVKFKLISQSPVHPYVMGGVELIRINPKDADGANLPNNDAKVFGRTQFGFLAGGGISFFLRDNLSVGIQSLYHRTSTDYIDDLTPSGANDNFLTGSLKLTFYHGGPDKDTDGDGIPDRFDLCPKQPEDFDGFEDDDGCPELDNDKDGIPDARDKCPNKAEDIDGFQDEDGCPDPDNDGDGIPDKKDGCPGTDQTLANNTNTKEDLDGYKDEDGCPDPDNDGDGIPDDKDKCPNQAETFNEWEDTDGCPDEIPEIILEQRKPIVIDGVFFQTGKANLDPNSESILDKLVNTLLDNPQIELEIRGHTDNTGGRDLNLRLSQARADMVKSYLVSKGVNVSRLTTKGLGPDHPLVSNETAEGRARNRRIAFFRTR